MESATMIFNSEKDIVMHIAALIRIAMADGKFLDSEKEFITNVASLYAGAYGTKTFEVMVDECIPLSPKSALNEWLESLVQRPIVTRNLIKDMISLAYVDGDYCESEHTEVHEMAVRLNVPRAVVKAIEVSVRNLITASQKLQAIIECGRVQKR